jgi:hypothetical protein
MLMSCLAISGGTSAAAIPATTIVIPASSNVLLANLT